MTIAAPLALHTGTVPAAWIDYNGHMNVAYYVLAFDQATDALLDYLTLDAAYRAQTQCSVFVLEAHVTYEQELVLNDPFRCTTQLFAADAKRIHYFHAMYHAQQGFLAATTELILLHVDLATRRSTPLPDTVQKQLAALLDTHQQLPRPPQAGRTIGIRRKT